MWDASLEAVTSMATTLHSLTQHVWAAIGNSTWGKGQTTWAQAVAGIG